MEIANGVKYGLTAGIACGNLGAGLRRANEIEAGRIWISVANGGPARAPCGAFKCSGVGKFGDLESLLRCTHTQAISVML
jgi:acyl-CoA reductase-like NAD-dependent aldehyde dehydrogenase